MSEINIEYPVECHLEHSKETVQSMLEALQDKYAIKHHFTDDHHCDLSGSGISGKVNIKDDGITIYAKLGFFMMPFKSVIENEINNKLNEYFADH